MSLDSLRNLRRRGGKPDAVRMLVGTKPKWLPDSPDLVVIRPQDDPRAMDLRPLVGVRLFIVEIEPNPDQMLIAAAAAIDAGAVFVGAVCDAGVVGVSKEHETAMERCRRNLCQ